MAVFDGLRVEVGSAGDTLIVGNHASSNGRTRFVCRLLFLPS